MDHDLFHSPDDDFHTNLAMFQNSGMPNVDPSHVWHGHELTPESYNSSNALETQPGPKSAQNSIVESRDQVKERFGQITPTEEDEPESFAGTSSREAAESKRKFEEEDIAKQNRTQRARNAANKRHSKAKTARRDPSHEAESDSNDQPGKSTNMQREKNRLAAAKCRAKKKATSEEMQDTHRDGSKQNNYLHREVRELRDQKAFLRNTLLQHEPGLCQCHAIHRFNLAQAQQLAMGVGALIGQPVSPSQESMGSGLTPGSDSMGRSCMMPGHAGAAGRPDMPSRPQSFNERPIFNNGQVEGAETYQVATGAPDQSMSGQFAEFLHSSPNGGRAGFA